MTNTVAKIEAEMKSPSVVNRVVLALGHHLKDDAGKNTAFQYISGVLMEIQKTAGDQKKDLTVCTVDSIVQSMIDSARFKLPIDGRQFAHLVKYGNKAQFQIGYRGYISKIKEHYPDADFAYGAIYEGDSFSVSDKDGYQNYEVKKLNPFETDEKKLVGVYVSISYSIGGRHYQKVTSLPKSEIQKIRGKAKQDFIWSEWLVEKAIAAAIKRACKVHFASLQGLQEVIEYDNEENFDIKPTKSVSSDINNIIEIENGIAQVETQEVIDEAVTG